MKTIGEVLGTIAITVVILAIGGAIRMWLWPPPPNLATDHDAADAIQCLIDLGFNKTDSVSRVLAARRDHPVADVNKLVNEALRR